MAARCLWSLYRQATPFQRSLAALRPFICPVDPILQSIPAGARVLDIGCGNGLALALMARYRHIGRGLGVDISRRAIGAARAMNAAAGFSLSFIDTASPRDWPDEHFDVVSLIDVLHHVPPSQREPFVRCALDRVAPGGRLVFKDMAAGPWWRVAWNQMHDLVLARQLVQVEPLAHVVRWAAGQGFVPTQASAYVACAVYGHELMVFERGRPAP